MTLHAALVATRKRRLRPEGYSEVAGAIVAFLVLVLVIQLGANLYLAHELSAPVSSAKAGVHRQAAGSNSWFFSTVNIMWCSLFLSSVAPLIAYRGIAGTARGARLAFFPLNRRRRLAAVVLASLRGVPVLVPVGLAIVAGLLSMSSGEGVSAGEVILFLAIALAGFLFVLAIAWQQRAREDHLELIEVGLLAAIILANPDFQLAQGRPLLLLFMYLKIGLDRSVIIFLLPSLGAVAAALAIVLSAIFGKKTTRVDSGMRKPGLVLYRSRIPIGLFAALYAVEIPVILTNPAITTTVRNIVLFLLGVRILWFLAFVFRTEQKVAAIIRAPQRFADRFAVYRPAAIMHAILCTVPVALYLARVILR